MDSEEILRARKILKKTQKQLAELLGTSIKAIHSYEQGWRSVPSHVERQIYFLLSRKRGQKNPKLCWIIKKCPPSRRQQCPAWEFQAGRLCWFINGTICEGTVQADWKAKIKICKSCEILNSLL